MRARKKVATNTERRKIAGDGCSGRPLLQRRAGGFERLSAQQQTEQVQQSLCMHKVLSAIFPFLDCVASWVRLTLYCRQERRDMIREIRKRRDQRLREAICEHQVQQRVHVLCQSLPDSRGEHADTLEDRGFRRRILPAKHEANNQSDVERRGEPRRKLTRAIADPPSRSAGLHRDTVPLRSSQRALRVR